MSARDVAEADEPADACTVVLVAGAGRSGTSLVTGMFQRLGLRVPQPEVRADETNPRGFGEPRWVVDFHQGLLERCHVQPSDARPEAWLATARIAARERPRARLARWLAGELADHLEIVVKDPRISWFLDTWRVAAARNAASLGVVTMLRPPTEVAASREQYYPGPGGSISRIAAWTNMMLFTELATRDQNRCFIRYQDLLEQRSAPVMRAAEQLRLRSVTSATSEDIAAAHGLIDPSLHRIQVTWEDLAVPRRLRELSERTWQCLDHLARLGDAAAEAHTQLDAVRADFTALYDEAAALASSSIVAARRKSASRSRRNR